ncbi:mucin-5B-like [Boleophthalmus pectinirostris]|uniref:mucin-5B-like n=1 Tax=Boleophthalmus pectinirostris TaxID=150288 RepID=UPI00242F5947|nr:mucin-5B-like [Boleophthalmus pectinirostris]
MFSIDTVTGFICRNCDQKDGRCYDYQVRFLCPRRFCVQAKCWTQWFDRDNPSGTGDWETLASLQFSYPEQICAAPLQIQGQTTTGLPASASGNVLSAYDTTVGLICKNSEQQRGLKCHDFQVRFLCPPDFCRPKDCYTDWFDRDDPSATGDWETLFALRAEYPGLICPNPLQIQVQTINGYSVAATGNIITTADVVNGFICQNSAQPSGLCHDYKVRFVCPMDFCQHKVCWTAWYDRDNPSGTGDWELLSDLKKLHPNEICETPLHIDVRTVGSNLPLTVTGQVLHIYSPTEGFACRNEDQTGRGCRDYKVRFGCPCKYIVDTD